MTLDYPALFALLGSLGGIVGAALAMSRSVDNRFAQLRSQLSEVEQRADQRLSKLKEQLGIGDIRDLSKFEALEYRINANRELIEHRTTRFKDELEKATKMLQLDIEEVKRYLVDIEEVKRYLDKTTDFQIRSRGNRNGPDLPN